MTQRRTVRAQRLGDRLRYYRVTRLRLVSTEASQKYLVKLMNAGRPKQRSLSTSHLSRLESGTARADPDYLRHFAEVLGLPDEDAAELEEMRVHAGERGWWQAHPDVVAESVEMMVELNEAATHIRSYNNAFLPGLLQIRDYAQAVIGGGTAFVRPIDTDRLVQLRMRRQLRLATPDFRGLTAVLTEGVIRQVVGGPGTMRKQLQHLLDVGRTLPVTIHVLPFHAGALPGSDNIVVFGFPAELDTDIAYVDGDTAQHIHQNHDQVRQCTHIVDAAVRSALPAQESLELIRTVQKEL